VEHYRDAWEKKLDRLHDYLHEIQAKEKKHARRNNK
jgi:hypothetical protein